MRSDKNIDKKTQIFVLQQHLNTSMKTLRNNMTPSEGIIGRANRKVGADLSDYLDEILGALWAAALQLSCAGL